jgi:hypothetical protein
VGVQFPGTERQGTKFVVIMYQSYEERRASRFKIYVWSKLTEQ